MRTQIEISTDNDNIEKYSNEIAIIWNALLNQTLRIQLSYEKFVQDFIMVLIF